jgi:2-polyprenyl-6-methoxyphenol hydroxylase-like FAD-dependent oxidoreductase
MVPCNGTRLLDRLGVYKPLLLRAAPAQEMSLYSSQGKLLVEMELGAWSAEKTGYKHLRIQRTDLQDVLLEKIQSEEIQIHYDKQLMAIDENDGGVTVSFSDGTTDAGDLLLGCDGIHSMVRKLYIDPQVQPEYSGISNIFSFLPASDLPQTASPITRMTGALTPHGAFALVPCSASNDTLFWMYSHGVPIPPAGNTRDGWEEHSKTATEGFKPTILTAVDSVRGQYGDLLKHVINLTEVVKFYPIFRLPLGGKWSRGRCLLLGDAGHAMAPHVGQGVGMALEDAFLLSRLLQASPSDAPLSEIFSQFDRIRRPRIEKLYKQAAGKGEQRKETGPWIHWMKEIVIWAALLLYKSSGLYKWGFWEGDVVYDIDKAEV